MITATGVKVTAQWSGAFTCSANCPPKEIIETIGDCVLMMQEGTQSAVERDAYENVLRLLREIKIEKVI